MIRCLSPNFWILNHSSTAYRLSPFPAAFLITTNRVAHPAGGAAGGQPASRSVRAGAAAQRLHAASIGAVGQPGGAQRPQSAVGGAGRRPLAQNTGHPPTA